MNAPVEWLIGVIRTLKVPIDAQERLDAILVALTVMGQRPFYPPMSTDGPMARAWLSTTSTAAQVWAAESSPSSVICRPSRKPRKDDRIDAAGYLIGVGAWTDRTVAALKAFVDDPQAARRGRRQYARIPDGIAGFEMAEINRRKFLIAGAGVGAAGLLTGVASRSPCQTCSTPREKAHCPKAAASW